MDQPSSLVLRRWHVPKRAPHLLDSLDLYDLPGGDVGGLIMERAEAAKARTYKERWEGDIAVWHAILDGIERAAKGKRPRVPVERLPPWLVAAAKGRLRDHENYWLSSYFPWIRVLERLGLADFPQDDDYVLSMLTGLVSAWSYEEGIWSDPVRWFRRDPALIERAYWRAYEIEGIGVVSLRVNDDMYYGITNWRTATQQMITEGMITRDRVIAESLAALDRDFSSATSSWFVRLLGDLALTDAELAECQSAIRRQLQHQAPSVVTNALAWLKRLDKAGLLDDEETAAALEAALLASTKIAAMTGLRLLSGIHKRTPAADVVTAARAGLGHGHADVQRAAARLLIAAGAEELVVAEAKMLEPSIRQEFGIRTEPDAPPKTTCGTESPVHPVLRPAPDSSDLTDRFAALLEHADDPIEIELILDRLARGGSTEALRPLAKRARGIADSTETNRLEQQLAGLVLAATDPAAPPVKLSVPALPWTRFLHARMGEVRHVLQGSSAPGGLLAVPTDPCGWLDPGAFVDRVLSSGRNLRRADLIAAMLRLAPNGRSEALRQWRSAGSALPTEVDQVLRYALGDDALRQLVPTDEALWVAAARAREPLGDDPVLETHGLDRTGQSRGLDPTVTLALDPRWRGSAGQEQYRLHVTYTHAAKLMKASGFTPPSWWPIGGHVEHKPVPWAVEQPTATADVNSGEDWRFLDYVDHPWLAWHGLTWPAEAEHYVNAVVASLFFGREWASSDPMLVVLRSLRRHPGRIGPTVAATLGLAMNGGTVEVRVHAADAVVDLTDRGRITTDALAAGLITLAPAVMINRWADTLQRIAATGRADVMIALLTRLLPAIPRDRRGVNLLVDLLHQELLRTVGCADDPQLRGYLAQFTGNGKAAKSARAVLAIGT